jgi:acyl-CoA synthetase (AMP-forming)/AMP-acid ligase II
MSGDNTQTIIAHCIKSGSLGKPAIVVPNGLVITYRSLVDQVDRVRGSLEAIGLKRGDRVAVVLPNSIEALICFFAVTSVAIVAPLNPSYTSEEIKFYIEDIGATTLITSEASGIGIRESAPEHVKHIKVSLDDNGDVNLAFSGGNTLNQKTMAPKTNDVALILHTSGTTSRPKKVPLTHGNLLTSVKNIVDTYLLAREDVSLCVMPLFHVHGLIASSLSTFASGGTVLLPTPFNVIKFRDLISNYGATWCSAVPAIYQTVLNRIKGTNKVLSEPNQLRFLRSCSSALPGSTMLELEDQFGVPVLEAYGMTEATHQMSSNPLPPEKRVPGSVGKGTNVDISIMDANGNILGANTPGEIVIKGRNVISGYEDNPSANIDSFTDGWFRTGDEGIIGEDGHLTIKARIKEIINRSGEKIAPGEIDEVLMMHDAVVEAVAFGVPHSVRGEDPCAAVVINSPVTSEELVSHCRLHLAPFKCPRTIYVVDNIPRTATGKVQRKIVAEHVLGNLSS